MYLSMLILNAVPKATESIFQKLSNQIWVMVYFYLLMSLYSFSVMMQSSFPTEQQQRVKMTAMFIYYAFAYLLDQDCPYFAYFSLSFKPVRLAQKGSWLLSSRSRKSLTTYAFFPPFLEMGGNFNFPEVTGYAAVTPYSLANQKGKMLSAWSFLQKADISLMMTSACFFWLSLNFSLEYSLTIDLRAVCLKRATNSLDSITPVSCMSFSVGTCIFSFMKGLMAMCRGEMLQVFLLSPHVSSTILSMVSPSLLWHEVTYCTYNPRKSNNQQQPQQTDFTSISRMYFSIRSRQYPGQQNLKMEASILWMIFSQSEFQALFTQYPQVSVRKQGKQMGRPNIIVSQRVPRDKKCRERPIRVKMLQNI